MHIGHAYYILQLSAAAISSAHNINPIKYYALKPILFHRVRHVDTK